MPCAKYMDELLGSGFKALHDLKSSGRIGAYGLGVNETKVCLDIMMHERLDTILLAGFQCVQAESGEEALLLLKNQ